MERVLMAYIRKSEAEKIFVKKLLSIGIVKYYNAHENGHEYWLFELKDGERRHWTDLSVESQQILGICSPQPTE